MDSLTEFWDSLGYSRYVLALCGALFLCHLINLIYRTIVVFSKEKPVANEEGEGVSVIITSNNKSDYLKENLESFLTQDYPRYEVIVVDECSEDDTQDVLADMQQKYPNLKTTRIFPDTKFRSTKKLAINIGILAASYDVLLFSEINCQPSSSEWVKSMQSYFAKDTAVVVGYANYNPGSGRVNIWRFFRFLRYLKLLCFIRSGVYVLGNGFNMGYRKKYYIARRGFSKNSQSYREYDNEMVKVLSSCGKVCVAQQEKSFVSIKDAYKKTWLEDFTYYYRNKRDWSFLALLKSDVDVYVRTLFFVSGFYLIFTGILHNYVAICILLTFLIDFIVINIYSKHLKQKKLFLTSFIISSVGFLYRWYYNVYSIFTNKKWR